MFGIVGATLPRILRRVLQGLFTVLVIVVINFFLLHAAPGDAAEVLAGEAGSSTPEYIAELRKEFGADKPKVVQLGLYIKNVVTLNLGYSFRAAKPVKSLIAERLGATLILMGTTLVISVGLGILLGVLASRWLNTWRDNLISLGALLAYATPLFWAGLMLIVLFSIHLRWLPTSGMENISAFYSGWERVADIARHLVLPAVTLSLFYLAFYTRLMRASMLEQAGLDYVTTARAKGLTESQITFRHMLRNAVLPVVTMAGMQIGGMLGGSVVVETVFAWPGLGYLAFQALFARDLNLLLSIFFICAVLVVLVNFLVDVLYSLLDPRIRTT